MPEVQIGPWRPTLSEGVWMNEAGTRWASISKRHTGLWVAQNSDGEHTHVAWNLEDLLDQ